MDSRAPKPSAAERTIPIAAALPEVWIVKSGQAVHLVLAGAKLFVDAALCGERPMEPWKRTRAVQVCMFCERVAARMGAHVRRGAA